LSSGLVKARQIRHHRR